MGISHVTTIPGVGPACCDPSVVVIEAEQDSHIILSATSWAP